MNGIFIHDHRFPVFEGEHYYSSGFDKAFFTRYLSLFDALIVIGRRKAITENKVADLPTVQEEVEFLLVDDFSKAMSANSKKNFEDAIQRADFCVVRLPSVIGVIALPIIKKLKKPYLVEMVACWWDCLIYSKSIGRKLAALPSALITRHLVAHAPYAVYVTESFLQRRYPTRGKNVHCSNVMLQDVSDRVLRNRLDKIQQRGKNRFMIGTTSTLDIHYKGQKYMIAALAELRKAGVDAYYELVGDGDASSLKEEAKRLGVEAYVQIIGRLPHDEVFLWLDRIDLYVHPSLQEGLPRAVIEAMSRGCPVIAANSGGIAELIENQYIVRKKNVGDLTSKIKRLSNNELANMAKKNHAHSKQYLISILSERRKRFFLKAMRGE